MGIAGCFSFHPSKNLAAAGDAGAVVTSDTQLDEALRNRRALGQSAPNHHVAIGLNSKLDVIQARILDGKLPLLDAWNARRREIAADYRVALRGLPLRFQREDPLEEHVYHLFQTRTEHRDRLLGHLLSCGVEATVRYPTPVHLQPAFSGQGWQQGQFPVAEALARELVCLPIRPDMTNEEIEYTADRIHEVFVTI
jgi:dTDP-4-amino-4,6-dideoxygalactose transaminase